MIQSVVKLIPVLIFVCFAFVLKGYSCTCEPFSNCTAYAYSKGVYTGTLLRVEEDTESAFPKLHAYFAIDRTFKGAVEKTVELTFARSECLPNFRVGTDYLIHKYPTEVQPSCNRTSPLEDAKADLVQLQRSMTRRPLLTISGTIRGLSDETRRKVRVQIVGQSGRKTEHGFVRTLDRSGSFDVQVPARKDYLVRLAVPDRMEVVSKDGSMVFPSEVEIVRNRGRITYEYRISLKENFCNYREVLLSPDQARD